MTKKGNKGRGNTLPKKTCTHRGKRSVPVGAYKIFAGGTQYFRIGDFSGFDLIIPLTTSAMPLEFGQRYHILAAPLQDYGGVHHSWKEFLDVVIEELKTGRKILAFCVGSHGRTGTFIASLIALLESSEETPDPVEAVRMRHCSHAVETRAQAEAIFALRGEQLPERYW